MSEQLAKLFHETYERLAPTFGYETRKGSAVPWDQVPPRNKNLMIAVADLVELHYFSAKQDGENEDDIDLGDEFFCSSGYGARTHKPFVDMSYNGRKVAQMYPESAIALAHNLLACAEAALGDAFLIEFMNERVGLELGQVYGLLLEYRDWRDQREEQEPASGNGAAHP